MFANNYNKSIESNFQPKQMSVSCSTFCKYNFASFNKMLGNSLKLSFFSAFNLDSATSDGQLNTFIDNHLQPNQSFNLEMSQTVDDVCRFFQEKMKPREIVKVL